MIDFSELMDTEFLERCLFGKKLQAKDQIIFKIYAKELFEMIENKVKKKKKRARSNIKIAAKKLNRREGLIYDQSRSKSPIIIEINRQGTPSETSA